MRSYFDVGLLVARAASAFHGHAQHPAFTVAERPPSADSGTCGGVLTGDLVSFRVQRAVDVARMRGVGQEEAAEPHLSTESDFYVGSVARDRNRLSRGQLKAVVADPVPVWRVVRAGLGGVRGGKKSDEGGRCEGEHPKLP